MEKDENLMIARHSMAHVLAKAIMALYPSTKLTIGPAIEDGFYYDIDLDENLSPSDYSKIEKKMQEILNKGAESREPHKGIRSHDTRQCESGRML